MTIEKDKFGTPLFGFHDAISSGDIPHHSPFSAIGERDNIDTTATGEDIAPLTNTTIPIPASAGEQLTLVSDDVQDTDVGTGARRVTIEYLDGDGLEQQEILVTDGTTGVDTVATDITFVNDMYVSGVGSNGVAEGEIIIYKKGAATTIYNVILAGGNKSLCINRKVASNKDLYITGWTAGVNGNKIMSLRLRSTCLPDGSAKVEGFLFKRTLRTGGDSAFSEKIEPPIKCCRGSLVKVSAWAEAAGNDISVSFNGYLKG